MKLYNLFENTSDDNEIDLSKINSYDSQINIPKGQTVIGLGKFLVSMNHGIQIVGHFGYNISVSRAMNKIQQLIIHAQFGKLGVDEAMDSIDDELMDQEAKYELEYPDGNFWGVVGYSRCLNIAKNRMRQVGMDEYKVFENSQFVAYVTLWGLLKPITKTDSVLNHLFPDMDKDILQHMYAAFSGTNTPANIAKVCIIVEKGTSNAYLLYRQGPFSNVFSILEMDMRAGRLYNAEPILRAAPPYNKVWGYEYANKAFYPLLMPVLRKMNLEANTLTNIETSLKESE